VLATVQHYYGGHTLKLVAWPSSPRAVADGPDLKLVLAESEQLARAVCDYEDDTDPAARMPRRFRNAIVALAPSPEALSEALQAARRYRAADEISKEHSRLHGQRGNPILEQLNELKPALLNTARVQALRAFNRVVLQGRPTVSLPEKYLVPRDSPLSSAPQGQAHIVDFLTDNRYLYEADAALDVDLLLEKILPGATPSLDHAGAFTASSVHERALSHERLRLMKDPGPVRQAILKAVEQGKLVVRLPNGDAYSEDGRVTGSDDARTLDPHRKLTMLSLTADVLLAPRNAPCVAQWLKVAEPRTDIALGGTPVGPVSTDHIAWAPPAQESSKAHTWDDAVRLAANRPLVKMTLRASGPEEARSLPALAQPFGAESLTLSVSCSGQVRDGATINFSANNVRYNHPLRPVDIAMTLYNAMTEGRVLEVELALDFGSRGRAGTGDLLQAAASQAQAGVTVEAHFEPEVQ
jgi:hypothetical protein